LPACKIAISLPSELLQRVDRWARRQNTSRSHFIAEQVTHRLRELEDEEVTRLYDEAYHDEPARTENGKLAEEMLRLAPETPEEEQW